MVDDDEPSISAHRSGERHFTVGHGVHGCASGCVVVLSCVVLNVRIQSSVFTEIGVMGGIHDGIEGKPEQHFSRCRIL